MNASGRRLGAGSTLACICALIACSASPATPSDTQAGAPGVLSLQRSNWDTISRPEGFPVINDADGHLAFDFPVDDGFIEYLYHVRPPATISGTVSVSFQMFIAGPVLFNYKTEPSNTCETPATVRPFLWANGNGEGEFDRWWSNPTSRVLSAGEFTLSVPLVPERWSSVFGKAGNADAAARAGFSRALQAVSRLGVTFGGGCFFGHGVNVRGGTARFVLVDYRIQ